MTPKYYARIDVHFQKGEEDILWPIKMAILSKAVNLEFDFNQKVQSVSDLNDCLEFQFEAPIEYQAHLIHIVKEVVKFSEQFELIVHINGVLHEPSVV